MAEQYLKQLGLTPIEMEHPPKIAPFWFEEGDMNENRVFVRKLLPTCVVICFLYFIFVILGPRIMKNRKPFDLQRPLILWNFSLALFSMMCVYRCLPQAVEILSAPNGFHTSTCKRIALSHQAAFWGLMYTLSKIAELVDTVFIVLRKKPLTFLHWFHHLTMLYLTFFLFSEAEPISALSALLNSGVHSIMYTYYGLMAMKFKLPRSVAMTVTSLQLIQFITGLIFHFYTSFLYASGGDCIRTPASIKIYTIVGITYLALFVRLFYNSYIANPKAKSA